MRTLLLKAAIVTSMGLLAWTSPPGNSEVLGDYCDVDRCLPFEQGCEDEIDIFCQAACDHFEYSYCNGGWGYCGPGQVLIHCYGWDD